MLLTFFVQPPWSQVADLLFKPGAACEQYKRPQKINDFKSKVLSGMKVRYYRVSGPCSHLSSHNPGDHEAVDIQEMIRRNNLLEKDNVSNASQFLKPNHPPLPRTSAVTQNPLSAIYNEAPALVNKVSPKLIGTKKQCLSSYTNEVMVSFTLSSKELELAFQELMKSKLKTDKEKIAIEKELMKSKLEMEKEKAAIEIKKKVSSAISSEEFKLFKNI
jgi:hypothetical protein